MKKKFPDVEWIPCGWHSRKDVAAQLGKQGLSDSDLEYVEDQLKLLEQTTDMAIYDCHLQHLKKTWGEGGDKKHLSHLIKAILDWRFTDKFCIGATPDGESNDNVGRESFFAAAQRVVKDEIRRVRRDFPLKRRFLLRDIIEIFRKYVVPRLSEGAYDEWVDGFAVLRFSPGNAAPRFSFKV
eukprot:Hpha_TRINITY_DN16504_c1_g1::TRINITY_DN16504_c1_g1_i1::g.135081::m.135081